MTVPQSIREALSWPNNDILVKITTTEDGFRVEKLPISHPQHPKKKLTEKEWDRIYGGMKKFSKSGNQDIKLTDFLRRDRDTRQ